VPLGRGRLQRPRAHGHVLAVVDPLRHGGPEAAVPPADHRRRAGLRAGDHRARDRVRHGGALDARRAARRPLRPDGRQAVHHERRLRRSLLRRGAHGAGHPRPPPRRHLDVPGRARAPGLLREPQARQNGHAGLRHRRARVRGVRGPGGEPARRRGAGLPAARGRPPARAPHGGRARALRGHAGARGHARVPARADGLRRAARRQAGAAPPRGRPRDRPRGRARARRPRRVALRRRRGVRDRGLHGEALRHGGREPGRLRGRAAAWRLRLHARVPGGGILPRRPALDHRLRHETRP